MRKLCVRASAVVLVAIAAASCGGYAPSPAKEVGPGADPDDALRALDEAETAIAVAIGAPQQGYAQPAASALPQAPPQPPPPVAPPPPPAQAQVPGHDGGRPPIPPGPAGLAPGGEGPRPVAEPARAADQRRRELESVRVSSDPCTTACSALASMERAADHLCGVAGPSDARCHNARDRVKSAAARVQAACPRCGR